MRLKEAYKTVEKADNLISQIGISLSYLTGDLENVSLQIEDMKQKRLLGIRIIKAQEEERQRLQGKFTTVLPNRCPILF